MKKMIRHGDVIIIPVEEIPSDAAKINRKELAYGEVTGHAHRIDVGELFERKNGELYLKVNNFTKVSHEEHKTKTLERRNYRIVQKRQYTPNGWQTVKD